MVSPAVHIPYPEGVEELSRTLLQKSERVLLFGPPGAGKSYLAAELARRLQAEERSCACLSADPGSPGFGIPAAINLGVWNQNSWQLEDFEALCSLDAARFRLPLAEAVSRLMLRVPVQIPLIIDAPGMTKGVAAAEMLLTLVNVTAATLIVVLDRQDGSIELEQEIASISLPVVRLATSNEAQLPSRHERIDQRTLLWKQYMGSAGETVLTLDGKALLGTPPPLNCPEKWCGLLISLGDADGPIAMGEVIELQEQQLKIRCHSLRRPPRQLLVRDARHLPGHKLKTASHRQTPKTDTNLLSGPSLVYPSDHKNINHGPQIRRRDITAELVNGLFEDPLLLIKTNWSRRCLLFDLGNTSRLPLRHAHNVSHVFISHAHFDHIGGFMGLLRVRLGAPVSCTLYGPPGLAKHIAGMLSGILWDRIGDNGPEFDIAELHGEQLRCFRLKAGHDKMIVLPERSVEDGIIYQEERFLVRAVELDHGTPVLAYAYEPVATVVVSEQAIKERQLTPGPWLGKLKYTYMAGEQSRLIELPNGESQPVGVLASLLLRKQAGKKLVYATDLADTAENRKKLITLAHHADTFICEAAFSRGDLQRGMNNGHLTTTACGEIAAAAGVKQLIPFHFSRRYEHDPEKLFQEIEDVFPNIVRSL